MLIALQPVAASPSGRAARAIRALFVAAFVLLPLHAFAAEKFVWDVPDEVESTVVSPDVKVDGVPILMRVVVSRADPQTLIQHFAKRFDYAGFFIARKQKSPVAQPILTAFDPKSRTTYSVIFDPGKDGTTTVVLGEARWAQQAHAAATADFAPVFPGATTALRSEDEGARVLSFEAKATTEEIRAYYASVLGDAGYRTSDGAVFTRRGQQIAVTTAPVRDGVTHVLLFAREADDAVETELPQNP